MNSKLISALDWREIQAHLYLEAELEYDLLEVESHKTVFYHRSAKTGQYFKKVTHKDHATKYYIADPITAEQIVEQQELALG